MISIDEELCIGCGGCVAVCPANPLVIRIVGDTAVVQNPKVCTLCKACILTCPWEAIRLRES